MYAYAKTKYMYAKYIFTASSPTSSQLTGPNHKFSTKTSKFNYPNIPTPTKETTSPTNFQKLNSTPKALQTAELNFLNFKLAVPPHK